MRPGKHAGFSLLEILVVVALFGLVAAMVIPNLAGPRAASVEDAAEQIQGRLAALTERSLVRGEVLGVRLEPKSLELQRYSVEEAAFVPLSREAVGRVTLPEAIRLEWQLEEQTEGEDLGAVVERRLLNGDEDAGNRDGAREYSGGEDESGDEEDQSAEAQASVPQLFFFPSGEATPMTLWIRDADSEAEVTLEIDALGRVRRPAEQGHEDN